MMLAGGAFGGIEVDEGMCKPPAGVEGGGGGGGGKDSEASSGGGGGAGRIFETLGGVAWSWAAWFVVLRD